MKNVKNVKNGETIQSYITRVSQIEEQLEVVDAEVENAEIVITTLNGLPRSWDSFIRGMCARRNLLLSTNYGKSAQRRSSTHKKGRENGSN